MAHGLLSGVTSLAVELRMGGLQSLKLPAFRAQAQIAVVHGLICSAARGIFPDQG